MKVSDVPQDLNYYKDSQVRDINYATDEAGRYRAVVSDGWICRNCASPRAAPTRCSGRCTG